MKFIAAIAVCSALACASTSSTSSPPMASSSGETRASGQCASGMVPAVVERDTDVYAGPDSTSTVVGSVGNSAKVCADGQASGYGFLTLPELMDLDAAG